MDIARFQQLNGIYAPLSRRASALCRALKESGFDARWGWYAGHCVLLEGEYRTECFPIPVVDVEGGCHRGGCDVGFHVDEIFVEFQLSRQAALSFDWPSLPAPFEVYGVEDYLHDFFREGMDVEGIAGRIEESGETAVNVALTFVHEIPDDRLPRTVSSILDLLIKETDPHGSQF